MTWKEQSIPRDFYEAAISARDAFGFVPRSRSLSYFEWGKTKSNPYKERDYGKGKPVLVGTFDFGLKTDKTFGEVKNIDPNEVREELIKVFPAGGSIILQFGWYEREPEDSMLVSIRNIKTSMADRAFKDAIRGVTKDLAELFHQREVRYEFRKGNKQIGAMKGWEWE